MKLYHNPKCTKSREVLKYFVANNINFEICDYMKNPLSKNDLTVILRELNYRPSDLIRKSEMEYKQFVKGKGLSEDEILSLMLKYPKLIERPIVLWDGKAVVARPIEKLISALTNNKDLL